MTADAEAALPEDAAVFERQAKALTLRNAGATWKQVAERLGCSVAKAQSTVRAALREVIAESAEDMIARQRSVLLDIQRANYKRAMDGDVDATRLILSSLEREAKLFGLDAPTRVSVGVSDVEFAERTASLIESLGLEPPRELLRSRSSAVLDVEVVDEPAVPGERPGRTGRPNEPAVRPGRTGLPFALPDDDDPADPTAPGGPRRNAASTGAGGAGRPVLDAGEWSNI